MQWPGGRQRDWNSWYGFWYLGPIQVPPQAPYVGMTDRTTGEIWYLCFDPARDGRISLTNTIPRSKSIVTRVFGPYDGPFLADYGLLMGVNNAHVVFGPALNSFGPSPYAFDLLGSRVFWGQITPLSTLANQYNHLQYEFVPGIFVGLTDRSTGQLWYAQYQESTGHVSIATTLPPALPNLIIGMIKIYTNPYDGPALGQGDVILGVRNGHLLWEVRGQVNGPLRPTLAFSDVGLRTPQAQFLTAHVTPPRGVADIPPDHIAFTQVSAQLA